MLLTRRCNYDCSFCIEKTKEDTQDNSSLETLLGKANYLINHQLVNEVLLLGGEPLYYKHIFDLIGGLNVSPILTTNGHRFLDDSFVKQLDFERIKAVNLSLPHYEETKRREIMRSNESLTNEEVTKIVSRIPVPVRLNVVLMRNYIGSEEEIGRMIEFASSIGIKSIKFGELTGINEATHDFVAEEVLRFNQAQYRQIPIKEMREKCHALGGSHFYKNISGVDVYFNSAPDFALSGGRDKNGKYYHAVLFNCGFLGFSWRRADGIYKDEREFLRLAQQNLLGKS